MCQNYRYQPSDVKNMYLILKIDIKKIRIEKNFVQLLTI